MLIEKWSCLQKIQEMEAYDGRKKGNPESDSDVSMCGCGVLCAAVVLPGVRAGAGGRDAVWEG